MTADTITEIPLEQLHESPSNPRQIYAGLDELAANIVAEGGRIHQPLLVRPRVPPLFAGDPDVMSAAAGYEIVFGHRRLRAAAIANLASAPCMVRSMSDAEARSAQVAENLQRADVHPFEEAEAFRVMLDAGDATADELALRFGKSRSYVYGRLALLKACPEIRKACLAGEIGSEVALLVARLRTGKLQEKALVFIRNDSSQHAKLDDGGRASFRKIRALLNERFALDLRAALFDTADAGLLPDAGACSSCPKRSGNAPEFEDVATAGDGKQRYSAGSGSHWLMHTGADVCTDPDCFAAKKAAHLKRGAEALAAKGKTVIDGNKARAAISAQGEVKGAYVALKDVREALKKAKGRKSPAGEPLPPPATVTIQDPRSGKTIEAVKREDLAAAGVNLAAPRNDRANYAAQERKRQEDHAKAQAQCEREQAHRLDLLQRVRTAAAAAERSAFDLGLVARAALSGVDWDDRPTLADLWGSKSFDELQKRAGSLPAGDLTVLLLDVALVANVRCDRPHALQVKPEALLQAAKHYGVPLLAPAAEEQPA